MRQVLTVLLVIGLIWVGVKFKNYFHRSMREAQAKTEGVQLPPPGQLPGVPAHLEPSLDAAKRQGAEGLRKWLRDNGREVQEPRLTELELDYVVLVGPTKPADARAILDGVKARITTRHPVYKRFQQLDKAYQ
jgi:hypothetical protein